MPQLAVAARRQKTRARDAGDLVALFGGIADDLVDRRCEQDADQAAALLASMRTISSCLPRPAYSMPRWAW